MPSVIIPAHNEASTIGACIRSVLENQAHPMEVVVIANGCTDDTVAIARRFEPGITVIDISRPGKTNALNLGESLVSTFPRAFVDGDIVLEAGALDSAFDAIADGRHLVSPPPRFDCDRAPLSVRLFYGALSAHPYFTSGSPNGSGVFVVSETGRARWAEFPEVIADDSFVELHFAKHEKATTRGPGAVVRVPETAAALLAIQTRARLGTAELLCRFPDLAANREQVGRAVIANLLRNPRMWPNAVVYCGVRLFERSRRRSAARRGGWLRDETSRRSASGSRNGAC